MITVLTGDNSFELNEALNALITAFDGRGEKVDGSEIEYKNIPDLLMGGTLFAEKRLVIIKDLSTNKSVWERLPEWLPRLSDDIHLVLVDAKPDKRTAAYKELKKKLVVQIVARVGLDQWQLASALEKLSLLDTISADTIEATIESNPSENVFQLFETALEGRPQKVHDMIKNLELTEDPYKLFALLSSQVFQLAAVANAREGDNPSKDFAIHPYVASKLARHAKRVGAVGSLRMLKSFAQADADMKISKADPWILIERALIDVR
jgi:DNA polymerase III delta subunit